MRFITANTIYPVSSPPIQNAVIVVNHDGNIQDVVTLDSEIDPLKVESFDGIICPGFINTHCHLELSHLKNQLSQQTGIVGFAIELIKKRFSFSTEEIRKAMLIADEEMYRNGIVAVGDISNDSTSFSIKSESKIHYHTFIELLSLNPDNAQNTFTKGKGLKDNLTELKLIGSFAPHAPYSVSTALLKLIDEEAVKTNSPISIHNQESIAEDDFIRSKKGDFVKLYELLNLPIDHFQAQNISSLRWTINALSCLNKTLLVHNTFTPEKDITWANTHNHNLYWCLCPHANLFIENKLPNISSLIANDCCITIGTDSLASNHSLSVLEELKVISQNFPLLEIEGLLTWATINGANFLGIGNVYGTIEKGKKPGLNLITNTENNYFTNNSEVKRLV